MAFARLGRSGLKNCLRVVWVIVIFWYELGIFQSAQRACPWPDSGFPEKSNVTHILVVADPQILDRRSYPDRNFLFSHLTQFIVDLNLRKNWRSALNSKPDAVLFLGDMMDGGRVDMPDSEYEQYYRRFLSIFKMDESIPRYAIPGNHDTGLGKQFWFSPEARQRYISHFGPLNVDVVIGNYTFVLLDGPGLVEEDYRRHGHGATYQEWGPVDGGPIDFVKTLAKKERKGPIILLNHIPLSRPEGSYCGPLREKGTIRRGVGVGYQNTLGKDSTQFLLESLEPVLILSGDDHDYCDYTHTFSMSGRTSQVREVTVKSLSMAMGIRQPGYQLLSLASLEGSTPTFLDAPCVMPDQLAIYLSNYIPFAVVSILIMMAFHAAKRLSPYKRLRPLASRGRSKSIEEKGSFRRREIRLRLTGHSEGDYYSRGVQDEENGYPIPPSHSPVRSRSETQPTLQYQFCPTLPLRKLSCLRRGTFLGELLRDIADVAAFPVVVFLLISFWIMTDS